LSRSSPFSLELLALPSPSSLSLPVLHLLRKASVKGEVEDIVVLGELIVDQILVRPHAMIPLMTTKVTAGATPQMKVTVIAAVVRVTLLQGAFTICLSMSRCKGNSHYYSFIIISYLLLPILLYSTCPFLLSSHDPSYVICCLPSYCIHVAWLWPVSHDLLSQVVSMKPPPVHGDPYLFFGSPSHLRQVLYLVSMPNAYLWIPIAPQAPPARPPGYHADPQVDVALTQGLGHGWRSSCWCICSRGSSGCRYCSWSLIGFDHSHVPLLLSLFSISFQ
jgi:hypothetical protein